MSETPKDPKDDAFVLPAAPPAPHTEKWRKWYIELRVAVADMRAVTLDLLRPVRERDLGHRQAAQLFDDASEKLLSLFAYVDQGCHDGGSEPGDPSGTGGAGPSE